MVGIKGPILGAIVFLVLFSPMGFAKSVSLKTIQAQATSDFGVIDTEIHFDERDLDVALKVKKIVEKDLTKVVNYFKYVPKGTIHINVDPYMRLTNGNARVFPTSIINLYNYPPNNADHLIIMEDWLRGLLFHEYIHVTHLDQTRDYLDLGRKIFGTVAKLPSNIVPRWFTEGIAVWGESHLMDGGRLNNPLFRKELLIQFLRMEYCTTIDCLDEPGVYPGGQLSYWAGAHFLEYVENKKANTIKCLIEENSGNIPFFLNTVFESCTGNTAQDLFEEFRQHFINSVPKETPEHEAWGDKISNAFGSDDLQKGIVLDGNKLFKVERDRSSEALVSYDLQDNVNMMVAKYRYPISDIVGITNVPAADNDQSDHGKLLIASFNEDLRFRADNRVWRLINTETLLVETKLPFKHDPSYVIGLGNNRYLTASFIDNKWLIERQIVDLNTGTIPEINILHHFGIDVNLTYFQKEGQKIFLKLNRPDIGTALYVTDLTMESFYKIHESKEYFDIPVLHENFLVIRQKSATKLVEFGEGFQRVTMSDLDKSLLEKVTLSQINNERVLVLENRLKTKEMPLSEVVNYFKKNSSQPQKVELVNAKFQDVVSPYNLNNVKTESFPQLYHMIPHYWFLASGSNENISSIGAMTTLSDPMELNVLNATVLTYASENKLGGSLDFNHKFSNVDDLWGMNALLNKEYSKTDFSDQLNTKSEGVLGTYYIMLMKRWTLIPGIYTGFSETQDFISDSSTNTVGVNATLSYAAASFDDYFQVLNWRVKLQNDHPESSEDFINMQTSLMAEGRFHERVVGGVKASYGRLYKDGFRDGVLFGGGTSSLSTRRWHEFYGLPYSNAYGNKISTFRLYMDWNFWNVYRGKNFIPVFLKEFHLLLGREMLSADRVILGNTIYRDRTLHSFFIGPKLKTNLFYYLPADLELIFSSIKRPNGGNSNQVEFNINADLF